MPRITLDRQIGNLKDEILLLGSMVEQAVLNAVKSLRSGDIEAANAIYEDDSLINDKRFAIENAILIIMATQHPMARDLRLLAAMLEIINELERMGDYGKGIAKITMKLDGQNFPISYTKYEEMAERGLKMLHDALTAFIETNPNKASMIPRDDDAVDALYQEIYHELMDAMIKDNSFIDQANLGMWAAHNLERLADRVINICERTIFISTGEMMEFDQTDDEDEEDEELDEDI
jgi:phosphate transport system protein